MRSPVRRPALAAGEFGLTRPTAESMLVLGYEPSKVRSRLFLADYSRAANDLGITPQDFLRGDHIPDSDGAV